MRTAECIFHYYALVGQDIQLRPIRIKHHFYTKWLINCIIGIEIILTVLKLYLGYSYLNY